MSTAAETRDRQPRDPEASEPGFMVQFRDPVARNYLFAALAALLVIAAVMFLRGGLPAALIPTVVAALGLLLRWTAMPRVFLLLLAYLIALPFGVPLGSAYSDVPGSHFRVVDVILVGAVLTYFACQYRLSSLTLEGMPLDVPPHLRRKRDRPPVRPGSLAPPEETGRLFAVIGLCLLIGQLAWLLVSELRIDFRVFPPVRLAYPTGPFPRPPGFGELSEPTTRFLLLMGLLAVVTVPAGLVFWYWRLARLNPAEARMVLLDTGWREARRELNRQEKWRAWGAARRLRARPWWVRGRTVLRVVFVASCILGVILAFWLVVLWLLLLRAS